jgi:hypothetical protein
VGTLDLAGFFGELVHAENVRAQIAALCKLHGAERAGKRPLTRVFQAVRLQAVLLVKRLKMVVTQNNENRLNNKAYNYPG